ncbi:hypothetical protein IJI29_02640 [Candidatus Saccharibacteria bacterium]|nr:hypothetical protein [Candidatus Saccharibacteria bacterium]
MSDYSEALRSLNSLSQASSSSLKGAANTLEGIGVWTIIAAIIAIVGGILIYFLFINAKTSPKGGFAKWLKDFLSFKILWIKPILKIAYCVATIFAILFSFNYLAMFEYLGGMALVYFLLMLIVVPIALRVAYEAALIFVGIWENTKTIAGNKK